MRNPIKDTSNDLLVLDTGDIADVKVSTTVREVERTGSQQYRAFVKERLVEPTKPITDYRLQIFRNPRKSVPSKDKHCF